jgi:CheY-like chemotaxis protein
MLAEGFADINPVVNVLLIVAVLALVIAAMVFLGPMERFATRLTRGRARRGTDTSAAGVLWVDDRPEHNARLLDGLREQGVRVDVARSPADALARLGERDYTIIVSDMSRVDNPDEGLRQLEQASGTTQVVVFSRYASTVETYRDRGVAVVSSEAEIRDWLRSVDLLP